MEAMEEGYHEEGLTLEGKVSIVINTLKEIMKDVGDDVSEVSVELNGVKIGFKRRLQ